MISKNPFFGAKTDHEAEAMYGLFGKEAAKLTSRSKANVKIAARAAAAAYNERVHEEEFPNFTTAELLLDSVDKLKKKKSVSVNVTSSSSPPQPPTNTALTTTTNLTSVSFPQPRGRTPQQPDQASVPSSQPRPYQTRIPITPNVSPLSHTAHLPPTSQIQPILATPLQLRPPPLMVQLQASTLPSPSSNRPKLITSIPKTYQQSRQADYRVNARQKAKAAVAGGTVLYQDDIDGTTYDMLHAFSECIKDKKGKISINSSLPQLKKNMKQFFQTHSLEEFSIDTPDALILESNS